MSQLGTCEQTYCSKPAITVVTMGRTHRVTGEVIAREFRVCAEHHEELTTPCDADGCDRAPATQTLKLPTTGEAFTFCNGCRDTLMNAGTVTVLGVTLLHRDGEVMKLPQS
jgi:hypothetical protein